MRLEPGDRAVIAVRHYAYGMVPHVSARDKARYGKIPDGEYEAVCVSNPGRGMPRLDCPSQPALSGAYNYWYGEKHGCTDNITAREAGQEGGGAHG